METFTSVQCCSTRFQITTASKKPPQNERKSTFYSLDFHYCSHPKSSYCLCISSMPRQVGLYSGFWHSVSVGQYSTHVLSPRTYWNLRTQTARRVRSQRGQSSVTCCLCITCRIYYSKRLDYVAKDDGYRFAACAGRFCRWSPKDASEAQGARRQRLSAGFHTQPAAGRWMTFFSAPEWGVTAPSR